MINNMFGTFTSDDLQLYDYALLCVYTLVLFITKAYYSVAKHVRLLFYFTRDEIGLSSEGKMGMLYIASLYKKFIDSYII